MTAPSAYNPKRLADYSFGDPGVMTWRGRRYGKKSTRRRSPVNTGRSRSEIEAESGARYKDFIRKDIDASEKRRTALESMMNAEVVAEQSARKQAVDEYALFAKGAPDPEKDIGGEGRAAYFNTPLGKRVTANMQAHIQASIDKSNRQKRQSDPRALAQESGLVVGSKGKDGDGSVAQTYQGYDFKKKIAGDMTERAAGRLPPPPDAPTASPSGQVRGAGVETVNAVDKKSGKNITVLGRSKDGKKLRVQDIDTLEEYDVPMTQVEPRKKSKTDYDIPV
jgi:hypothetical protein